MASEDHIICVAASESGIDGLLGKISDNDGVVQLFDESAIACRAHLEFAYLNAVKIHERGESRTRSPAMEMLLCAAMTSQIGDAIRRVGAKTGMPLIVFADSRKAYNKIALHLTKPAEFDPGNAVRARLIRIGIKSGNVEDLIQEIALHAMDR